MLKELEIRNAYPQTIGIPDEAFNFELADGYESPTPDDVNFALALDIGVTGEDWSEHFYLVVVTPNNRPGRAPDLRCMVLPTYSYATLRDYIVTAVKACERDSWEECLVQLRKRFRWEHEEISRPKEKR
jgi:hypothetical protein